MHVAHRAVQQLRREGYHPVIIGQRGHVEVQGLTGDLDEFDVVLNEEDVQALGPRPRLGIAAQTTQPLAKVHHLVGLMRKRFPQSEVRFIDTVCQPTKLRQKAAVDLARQSDVVIVVGGADSNNTRELVVTCRRHCPRVHQVQAASDLLAGMVRRRRHRGSHGRHVDAGIHHRRRRWAAPADRRRAAGRCPSVTAAAHGRCP